MFEEDAERLRGAYQAFNEGGVEAFLERLAPEFQLRDRESSPEPVRRSFFNYEGDEVSPIDNDNYFFNVSHTMGDRVTCSLLRGAGETAGAGTAYRSQYQPCAVFANDLLNGHGADAAAPSG